MLDAGREFSRPSYPCVEMLIRRQLGTARLERGAPLFAQTSLGLSPRAYLDTELKSKRWGFETCFGLSRVMNVLDKNGQFLDHNGSSGAVTRGWVTHEGQVPLSRARQQLGRIPAGGGGANAVAKEVRIGELTSPTL